MLACHPLTRPVHTTAPTKEQEPVTLAEARKQCEIAEGVDAHDAMLTRLIALARESVERDASVVCYTGTFTWKFTEFGGRNWFEIPIRPVTSISSIVYVATGGTSTTWTASEYVLDTHTIQPIVRLAYGYSWPTLRGDINGVTVTMAAGYATVGAIPQLIKHACLLDISRQWADREGGEYDPRGYDRLIEQIRRSVYA